MNRARTSPHRRPLHAAAGALLGALILGCLSGCNLVAGAGYLIHGPEKVPQLYDLVPDKKTVVLVDDRENRLPRRMLRQVIGESTTQTLLDQDVVLPQNMIDSRSAIAATVGEKAGDAIYIVDVGRHVGADQVIYVWVDRFTLSPDNTSFAPEAIVYIKVVDVATEKRLWPEDERAGYPMQVRPPKPAKNLPQSLSEVAQAENEFAKIVGRAIAEAFFKTTVNESVRNAK